MSTMQELLAAQQTDFGLIARTVVNLNKLGKQRITSSIVRSRLQQLRAYWDRCRSTHSVIINTATAEEKKTNEYFTEDQFSVANDNFDEASDHLSELLEKLTTPISQQALDESLSQIIEKDAGSNIQLPRINLPHFSGNYADWQHYHDMFKSLIISNLTLNKVQKLHYLKTTLTGEASLLLKNVSITENNFQAAWDLLNKRYANTRSLVHAHLQLLLDLTPLTSQTNINLKSLRDKAADIRSALINLKRPVTAWEDLFNYIIISKLDKTTRREWEVSLGDTTDLPDFSKIDEFLTSRIRANEAIYSSSTQGEKNENLGKRRFIRAHQTIPSATRCLMCNDPHPLYYCSSFKNLSILKRKEFVNSNNLCLNCLKHGHTPQNCRNTKNCFVCHERHHTLLHTDTVTSNKVTHQNKSGRVSQRCPKKEHFASTSSDPSDQEKVTISNNNFTHHRLNAAVLPTAYVILHTKQGRSLCVRALLDQGSQYSFITQSVAQLLKVNKKSVNPVTISGIADSKAGTAYSIASLQISSCNNEGKKLLFDALILPKLTSYAPRLLKQNLHYKHLNGLDLADPNPFENRGIDLIIGAELFGQIMRPGLRLGPTGSPMAQNTIFGWIISGPTRKLNSTVTSSINVNLTQLSDLNDLLTKFWETESFPEKSSLTPEETWCEEHFVRTHKRDTTGRYTVRIPFKNPPPLNLGETKTVATKIFLSNEARLKRKPEIYSAYQNFLAEYESANHMLEVTSENDRNGSVAYLPHHPVLRENSQTTKLRVVFNGSKPSSNGNTLNSFQHIGQKLQADLPALILHWRTHRYVFTADIKQMFRQILVDRRDTKFQKIVWRKNPEEALKYYELLTVTYGTASAPFLANRVLKQLARDEFSNFPLACQILETNVYVDDVMFGADDEAHAKQLQSQLSRLLTAGGFHLYKWASNSKHLLNEITDAPHAFAVDKILNPDEQLKVLGLHWKPASDSFTFTLTLDAIQNFTKRNFLSLIARIFDPLGWISPFTISGKIIIQELWLTKINWDDQLPKSIQIKCLNFQKQLYAISQVTIPRWIQTSKQTQNLQIHGFSDASERAYAAAVYIRIENTHCSPITFLLFSKTKVAPLKLQSIPRLELCGAHLLIKSIEFIQNCLKLSDIQTYCWTDSTVVLHWLSKHPSKWKTFVANRVSEIQTSQAKVEWRYVNSKHNPADCASRGINACELLALKLWWYGPPWLTNTQSEWPSAPLPNATQHPVEESKQNTVHACTSYFKQDDFLIQRFSSFSKLLRVTAYVFRFIQRVKKQETTNCKNYLTTTEIIKSRNFLIKIAQNDAFQNEISKLNLNKSISPKSKIYKLSPYLDDESILRVGGRLTHSLLSDSCKHPIILADCQLSTLIIAHYHIKTLHGGVQLMLHALRQHYWIVSARILIKRHIRNCVVCVRHRAAIPTQRMGDLPAPRIQPSRPFTHTGIDYAGPFQIRSLSGRGHKTNKCYIALFVCLATKAIHLELVYDYSTNAFLAALSRFSSRRGLPSVIYSDNGTNFHGASNEISNHFKTVTNSTDVQNKLATDQITWTFIPPAAPHFGGLWEAGVKSVKHHLRRILGDFCPTGEEFTTLLCEIECCLNSRPITPLYDDVDSLDTLTPGHFLTGTFLKSIPQPSVLQLNENRLSRWQTIRLFTERFWKKWQNDYLNSLQTRQKWTDTQCDLKVGDLVLLRNSNLPPSKWELGRVINRFPGKDSLTRVVKIKTSKSEYIRPIQQLCKLPVNTELNNHNENRQTNSTT